MIEDNNTEETKIEQALAKDDTAFSVPHGLDGDYQITLNANALPFSTSVNANSFVTSQPQQWHFTYGTAPEQPVSDTAYVNISPADFATIRTMIREELQSLKGEIVKQVKDEIVKDIRLSMGVRSNRE